MAPAFIILDKPTYFEIYVFQNDKLSFHIVKFAIFFILSVDLNLKLCWTSTSHFIVS